MFLFATSIGRGVLGLGDVIRAAEALLSVDRATFDCLRELVFGSYAKGLHDHPHVASIRQAVLLKAIGYRRQRLQVPGPQAHALEELDAFCAALRRSSLPFLTSLTTVFSEGDRGDPFSMPHPDADPVVRTVQLVLGELDPVHALSLRYPESSALGPLVPPVRTTGNPWRDTHPGARLRDALEYATGCEHFLWSLREPDALHDLETHLGRIEPDLESDRPVVFMADEDPIQPTLYIARDVRTKGLGLREYYIADPKSRRSAWFEGPALCYGQTPALLFGLAVHGTMQSYLTRLDIHTRL